MLLVAGEMKLGGGRKTEMTVCLIRMKTIKTIFAFFSLPPFYVKCSLNFSQLCTIFLRYVMFDEIYVYEWKNAHSCKLTRHFFHASVPTKNEMFS